MIIFRKFSGRFQPQLVHHPAEIDQPLHLFAGTAQAWHRLAETTAEAVRQYSQMGLLGEEGRQGSFGEGTLFLVRRIEQLRIEYGMPAEGAGLVLDLAARIEELEEEIRALREAMG